MGIKARILSRVLLMGLFAAILSACSNSGASFVKDMDAALAQVPGVTNANTDYNTNNGMSTRITVRITASPEASLETVLSESLHSFADASGSTKGVISVSYYVFTQGDEENGIHPDALGLKITPTVDEIRKFANGAQ